MIKKCKTYGISGGYFLNTVPYVYGKILKHSENIIDLIEVGDYVNSELITQAKYDLFINSDFKEKYAKNIKSIVTKEQFEIIKYKVGD